MPDPACRRTLEIAGEPVGTEAHEIFRLFAKISARVSRRLRPPRFFGDVLVQRGSVDLCLCRFV
jgi:hypothetical protein